MLVNATEAGKRLGISSSRVRRLAVDCKVGTRVSGHAWVFTEDDLAILRTRAQGKPGRPKRHGDPTEAEPPLDASPAEPMGS